MLCPEVQDLLLGCRNSKQTIPTKIGSSWNTRMVAKVLKDTILIVRLRAYTNVMLHRNSIFITSAHNCFDRLSPDKEIAYSRPSQLHIDECI